MGSISTNVNALNAQQSFRINSEFQAGVIQRLSSGYRINQAGDDPAGLSIANTFRAGSAQLTEGVRNLNDGISRLQIADGGMSNISQILDRLKTLATQSASDTFSGDRGTLNSEFQTLLTEVDRQAQSVGLNTNGLFAKMLPVFVGGAGSDGSGGTINIDLSASAIDSQGLGLGGAKSMQAVAGSADIGTNSPNHTVAQIVADPLNAGATPNNTNFYFSGPGFSDGNAISLSVNLQGVTTLDSLAASINAAIQAAASGPTPAAAAFQKAGIVASAYNGQELAFTSSDTPFQVAAGDVMANALMGNLTVVNGLAGTTGTALANTVQGVTTGAAGDPFVPTNVTVRISGGNLAPPVDIKLSSLSTNTASAITDLETQVNGNAQLQAAGITVSGNPAGQLTFTGSHGEQFSVQATGDTAGALGLGSFVAGAGGAVDYTAITGTPYDNTVATGSAHLEFSINGAPSIAIAPIDLAGGDAVGPNSRSGSDLAQAINTEIAANPALQSASLVATFDGTSITIASGNNTSFRLNAGSNDPLAANIGFGTAGQTFATTLTAAATAGNSVDSSGASAVASLSFAPMSYGNDSQTITVSAADLTGAAQTATITLGNNPQGREGRSIDETIAAINTQLQNGSSTLQQIVAVKENVGGQEQIGFMSSLRSFSVTVGPSVNGDGLNGGAAISATSAPIGSPIDVSVATKDFATVALAAINGAVTALGAAQAVVGKAENQLSYAIDLSQSEVTNFASAESRIRDTDVAADAANLTKTQILAQASISAMAQANSAAQAVLALLKG